MYHAQLGRFASRDPIGYWRGNGNTYDYVQNGPVSTSDPGGLRPITIGPPETEDDGSSGTLLLACFAACGVSDDFPIGSVLDSECFKRCIAETPSKGGFPVPPGGSFGDGSHHAECCGEAERINRNYWGMTVCCEGKPVICIFDNHIVLWRRFQRQVDPTALQIIRLCVIEHERTHLNHIDCSSREKMPGYDYLTKPYACPGYGGRGGNNRMERESCEAEWRCLNAKRGMCGSNAKCIADVDKAIDQIKRQCKLHGSKIDFERF